MYRRTDVRSIAILMGLLAASSGFAQTPPPDATGVGSAPGSVLSPQTPPVVEPAAGTTPAIAASTEALIEPAAMRPAPLAVPPSKEALDATIMDLARMQSEVSRAGVEIQLLTQKTTIADLNERMGNAVSGTREIPELLAISGTRNRLVAEFLTNGSLLSVSAGGWVTPEWKLMRVMSNGVELSRKGSNTTNTILFGHRPEPIGTGVAPSLSARGQSPAGAPVASQRSMFQQTPEG